MEMESQGRGELASRGGESEGGEGIERKLLRLTCRASQGRVARSATWRRAVGWRRRGRPGRWGGGLVGPDDQARAGFVAGTGRGVLTCAR